MIYARTTFITNVLGIRNGVISGDGTVKGNLQLGNNPGDPKYNPATDATNPWISPVSKRGNVISPIGELDITGDFTMFSGHMDIEVASPTSYDLITVNGNATLSGTSNNVAYGGFLKGILLPKHPLIPANTEFDFLKYGTLAGDFTSIQYPADGWTSGKNATTYWLLSPNAAIPVAQGQIGGKVFGDNGAVAGVFDPDTDAGVANVTVNLLDSDGNFIASTTTDADGDYEFVNLDEGVYQVQFVRPDGERFSPQNVGDDTTDSDPDPATGLAWVSLYDDDTDGAEEVFAGLYANTAPIAVNDSFAAHLNTAITGNVVANDTDADGDTLTAALGTGPAHGTLTLNANGSFTYTPNTGYSGTDSFTYIINDGYGGTNTVTATITIASTAPPVGTDDTYTTAAGPLEVSADAGVLANDTNPNSETLSAVLAAGPSHGWLTLNADGSFSYIPHDSFVGTDSFTYRPTDADGPGAVTTVTISVTDHPPVAADDTASTDEDTPVTISVLSNDTDADGDTLTVIGASDGIYGTTTVNNDGTITYTPSANFNGIDIFTYVIDDGSGRLSTATVTVTVNPVNDAPIATAGSATTPQNTAVDIDLRTLVSDVETAPGDMTFAVSGASHGTVTLLSDGYTAQFTPTAGYHGAANFTYTATDTGDGSSSPLSASATVTVSVNSPPTATDMSSTVLAGGTVNFFPSLSDPDGDTVTVSAVTQGAHGTVTILSGGAGFSYTATDPAYTGTDTFTYTVSDGFGGLTVKTVTLSMSDTAPTAFNVTAMTTEGTPVTVNPMWFDPDGDTVSVSSYTQGSHGTVALNLDGTLLYTPNSGFTGTDTFTYTVDDGHGGTSTALATITVTSGGGIIIVITPPPPGGP